MYVCNKCKNKISPYKKKCSICNEKNIHFNDSIVTGLVVFFASVTVGILLSYVFREFGILQLLAFSGLIGLIIFIYIRYASRDEFEERIKLIIKEKGDKLFLDNDMISLDDLLLECGWKTDKSQLSEKIKLYLFEVASHNVWRMKDNYIYKK